MFENLYKNYLNFRINNVKERMKVAGKNIQYVWNPNATNLHSGFGAVSMEGYRKYENLKNLKERLETKLGVTQNAN